MGDDLLDEPQLIKCCQHGDYSAFEALFALYSRRVLQTAYLITGDRTAAEDILQQAFIQTFRAIAQLKEPTAFSSWLYRITVRAARRYLNKERALEHQEFRAAGAQMTSEDTPDKQLAEREAVWAAIENLPENYRTVVVLYYFEDRSVADIATIIEVPSGTVKTWLRRARAALAKELGNDDTPIGDDLHG
jgi:RNA polymerase sigma-70 factor (ECF subfamily)